MTPAQWNLALSPEIHWKQAYKTLADHARAALSDETGQITTVELVNRLYPPRFANNDVAVRARKRMFKGLIHMAAGDLEDCAARGPAKIIMGRVARPWLWHTSTGVRRSASDLTSELLAAAEAMLDGGEDWDRLEAACEALRHVSKGG